MFDPDDKKRSRMAEAKKCQFRGTARLVGSDLKVLGQYRFVVFDICTRHVSVVLEKKVPKRPSVPCGKGSRGGGLVKGWPKMPVPDH